MSETAPADASVLIRGLADPRAFPHPCAGVEVVETHISWVLLAGDYAYKIKKPVALGFLDFSTLARRRFYCQEELRLNRRLAPRLYLDVVPITGPRTAPRVDGDGPVLEYAVRMRRFAQQALLTRHPLDGALIDRLTLRIADFHAGLPPAPPDAPYGAPDAVMAPMRENFTHILGVAHDSAVRAAARRLERWTALGFVRLRERLEARRRQGFVRECHGDLHRGNIAVIDGEPLIFDCIEFNPALRWIDTVSELAFLVMDLREAGETALARRCLNGYLERTGDYAGLGLLRFYAVYRAMVRAKVIAIRLSQPSLDEVARADARMELSRYLRLARGMALRRQRRLIITCGLSGSGKTRLCGLLREALPLIHLRSDVERKRLFGLAADARTASPPGAGIYGSRASRRTYGRLLDLARSILDAGFGVIVDATFLKRAQRARFRDLAAELGCGFSILVLDAPVPVLRRRILRRLAAGADASEAGLAVLEAQIAARESLTLEEHRSALLLETERPGQVAGLVGRLLGALPDRG